MDIVVVLLLLAIFGVIFVLFNMSGATNINKKTGTISKEQLELKYQKELRKLLEKHKNDPETQKIQKMIYIKNLNDELSRNIYFTHDDAKNLLQKLASM